MKKVWKGVRVSFRGGHQCGCHLSRAPVVKLAFMLKDEISHSFSVQQTKTSRREIIQSLHSCLHLTHLVKMWGWCEMWAPGGSGWICKESLCIIIDNTHFAAHQHVWQAGSAGWATPLWCHWFSLSPSAGISVKTSSLCCPPHPVISTLSAAHHPNQLNI